MRKGFLVALLTALLFGGGYFYYTAQAVCPVPISYSVGEIDPRFDLTKEEARLAISEAESVWEDATGRNLFSYEENGDLVVNFIYDDRQHFLNAEGTMKEKLDATENISEAIKDTYASLVAQYDDLKNSYETRVETYEQRLAVYNGEVEKYNERGGAPEDVYAKLTEEKDELDEEQESLNDLSEKLNTLVKEINDIGEKGNSIINTYNKGVNLYNEKFGDVREFTQGDYGNGTIQIYTFENPNELKQVLVHELGHALSLGHVEGEESQMYFMIGKQPSDAKLSSADLQEFNRVCGEKSVWERLKMSVEPN